MTDFGSLFDPHRVTTETLETLFTIVFHHLPPTEAISAIEHRLQLAKEMKVSKKKATVCQRLTNLKHHLDEILENQGASTASINAIFLISDEMVEIPLTPAWISLLDEYHVDRFLFKYGQTFAIDYLRDLLTDLRLYHILYVRGTEYTHILMNPTKRKTLFTKDSKAFDLEAYLSSAIPAGEKCVIHGVSSALKNFKCDPHWIVGHKLDDEEILRLFHDGEVMALHKELSKAYELLNRSTTVDRLVFGKAIERKIVDQALQTLYCSPMMFDKVMTRLPADYRQSKMAIHRVESLTKGDAGDRLATDFGGILGVTYY